MRKVALVLSGCGQHDGSETHETILTLLSLAQEKIEWDAFAPDILQATVVNHFTGAEEKTSRNALLESARLVRGKITPLSQGLNIDKYSGIIIPGGLGAVTTLCDYKNKNTNYSINKEVKTFISAFIAQKKPAGFICIAPVIIPMLYKNKPKMTIGEDQEIAAQMESLGAVHVSCSATDAVVDQENKIVSTPANMVASDITEVYIGIKKLVAELSKLMLLYT